MKFHHRSTSSENITDCTNTRQRVASSPPGGPTSADETSSALPFDCIGGARRSGRPIVARLSSRSMTERQERLSSSDCVLSTLHQSTACCAIQRQRQTRVCTNASPPSSLSTQRLFRVDTMPPSILVSTPSPSNKHSRTFSCSHCQTS